MASSSSRKSSPTSCVFAMAVGSSQLPTVNSTSHHLVDETELLRLLSRQPAVLAALVELLDLLERLPAVLRHELVEPAVRGLERLQLGVNLGHRPANLGRRLVEEERRERGHDAVALRPAAEDEDRRTEDRAVAEGH